MIRDRIEALIAAWPATNGDPPDTDYQRGYLAACEEHAGTTYYFCNPGCAARFRADPGRFLGGHGHPGESATHAHAAGATSPAPAGAAESRPAGWRPRVRRIARRIPGSRAGAPR